MLEALEFEFFQHAMIAGVLSAVLCGIIGVLVVVNRIVFISAGTAHAAYGGIGLAFYLGWPILWTTMGFSMVATVIMAWVIRHRKHRADSIIGVLWAGGMALGIILTDLTPGYHPDLMSYLFGSILAIPVEELYYILGMDIFVTFIMLFYYREFVSFSYDEEFSRVRGVPVDWLYLLLLLMISLSVVLLIRVVGLIMIIALLTIPPLIVEPYAKSMGRMMLGATGLSVIFAIGGLWLSYSLDISAGASIIAVAVAGYGISFLMQIMRRGGKNVSVL
ncbi:MAG: hypothetical protein COB67_11725 [SAR324 cluster bacterium]|uniref:Metal ABC transporter permease n=1 Tax=SAR324 cluster bacterium TaxID=2024889 RepID=A0A2A4STB6_9DELT|nr:MAG: hypothetical protein COB67_11725 [SAR324 cluster bacterium]